MSSQASALGEQKTHRLGLKPFLEKKDEGIDLNVPEALMFVQRASGQESFEAGHRRDLDEQHQAWSDAALLDGILQVVRRVNLL